MTDLVVDASVLVLLVGSRGPLRPLIRERIRSVVRHAPHLVDAEVGNALRRQLRSGEVSGATALAGLQSMSTLVQHRYPHAGPLAQAAWGLRDSISFYDALYVALAVTLDVPLLTADARLARAPQLPCQLELVA